MTIKSENPLPWYAFRQKSVTDGRTDEWKGFRSTDNAKTISPPSPEIFRRGIIIKMLYSLTMSWKKNNIFANDTCMAIYKFNIETYKFLYLTKYSSTSSWSASSSCNTSRPMCQPHKHKCATFYMRERQIRFTPELATCYIFSMVQTLLLYTLRLHYNAVLYNADSIITRSDITRTPL